MADAHRAPQHRARAPARVRHRHPASARASVVPHRRRARSRTPTRGLPDAAAPRARRGLRARSRELERAHARGRAPARSARRARRPLVAALRTIPGVGLLTATALVAFVGDVQRFPSGRHFASYLGLTPRECSSGLRRRLGAISKRGDAYLRMLLIHGARSVLCHAKRAASDPDRLRAWALAREHARGHNKAAVALANKLARIVWAVWRHERAFDRDADSAPTDPHERIHPQTAPSTRRVMAHRSDRRGEKPITSLALEAAVIDWLPARDFPSWPGAHRAPHKRPEIRLQSNLPRRRAS